jgi:hypothetical protein
LIFLNSGANILQYFEYEKVKANNTVDMKNFV